LLETTLRRWDYEVVIAKNGVEASDILLSPDAPRLALLDWMMPDVDGPQLCQNVRRNSPEPYTYIVLLTGKRTQDDIIAGLDAGADDYITKPFDAAELKARLRAGKRILLLQEQLIKSREALRDQATHDSLTGLWNRQAILELVGNELDRARRQGAAVAISMTDVDYFKRINDTYGHPTGDEVLRRISKTLRDSVRRYDSVGRYGGEEFLIVLPGCDSFNAAAHAERMRGTVSRISLDTPKGILQPTMSFGVAVCDHRTGWDPSLLIQLADDALYRAKYGGKNRVELGAFLEPATV
jgi:diguanylate cyclase (GGDEF)-like protein